MGVMSLANGILAIDALRTLVDARKRIGEIELQLKVASTGNLLAADAVALLNNLTVHQSNLLKADPAPFPNIGKIAADQVGDDGFDYSAEYAALTTRITDLITKLVQVVAATGVKDRKVSPTEAAPLADKP